MKRELTCINCPLGCVLEVEIRDGEILGVQGNSCRRGDAYARQECLNPTRFVTDSIVMRDGSVPLSVRTREPVPKAAIDGCLAEIRTLHPRRPVHIGQVIRHDLAGTGVDLIATRNLEDT